MHHRLHWHSSREWAWSWLWHGKGVAWLWQPSCGHLLRPRGGQWCLRIWGHAWWKWMWIRGRCPALESLHISHHQIWCLLQYNCMLCQILQWPQADVAYIRQASLVKSLPHSSFASSNQWSTRDQKSVPFRFWPWLLGSPDRPRLEGCSSSSRASVSSTTSSSLCSKAKQHC